MQPRLNPSQASPNAIKAIRALDGHVQVSGLEPGLIELVRIRASQINGCAFCIHKHTQDALARGETAERLLLLDAWHETPLYSDRERAALAWTEALTLVAQTHAPDADYEQVRRQFAEAELVELTLAIATINALNRLGVGFRLVHPVRPEKAAA